MIEGTVDDNGVPIIEVSVAGRAWTSTIDTGFNGYVELPEDLRFVVHPQYVGPSRSLLAGGVVITVDHYIVRFPFDGEDLHVRATFAPGDGILIGTGLLRPYRLTVDFPEGRVWLERD